MLRDLIRARLAKRGEVERKPWQEREREEKTTGLPQAQLTAFMCLLMFERKLER